MLAMSKISYNADSLELALRHSLLNNTLEDTAWQAIGMPLPTTSPYKNRKTYQRFLDSGRQGDALGEHNSCSQFNMPNIPSFPGFFSVTVDIIILWFL